MIRKDIHIFILIASLLFFISNSLLIGGPQQTSFINEPFKTVKFINYSIFFTVNSGRAFGYLNISAKGSIQTLYLLEQSQRIVDEFSLGNKLIIGNKNKSLIHFEPFTNTLQWDDRFVGEDFNQLRGFKEVNNKVYIITEDSIKLYQKQFQVQQNSYNFIKDLISLKQLSPGIQQSYLDIYYFPTKKNPERVFALTTAIVSPQAEQQQNQQAGQKYLVCLKWFQRQDQQVDVDGGCTYQQGLNIESFTISGRYGYLRINNKTYVYDQKLVIKTKWDDRPTQYIGGHAVTQNHLTYLFKTNQLVYHRMVQNFKNDEIKMTANDQNLFISKKNKNIIKLKNDQNSEVIGSWILQTTENTFQLLIQFDSGELDCYKVVRGDKFTSINYLFRLGKDSKKQQRNNENLDQNPFYKNYIYQNEIQMKAQTQQQFVIDPVPVSQEQMQKINQQNKKSFNIDEQKQLLNNQL